MLMSSPVGIGAWTERCALLELGARVLRQVSHHRLLIDVWIRHLVWLDELAHAQEVIGEAHGLGGVLKRVFRIPSGPVGAQTRRAVVDQSADRLAVIPV